MCDATAGVPRYAGAKKGIQLVDEDYARRELARKREDRSDQLLALADIL